MTGLSAEAEALLALAKAKEDVERLCPDVMFENGGDYYRWETRLEAYGIAYSAAAHARGVAEERARWEDEARARLEDYGSRGESYSDAMADALDALIAAMAPSSPQDDRGAPEGSAGV